MGFFDRLKKGLSKSRGNLTERVDELVENTQVIDADFYEELTDILLLSDVGVKASTEIIDMDDASLPLSPGGDAGEGRSFSLPEFFNGFTWAAAIPVGAKIGIAAGCVIVIAVFVWLFLGKKKKK